LSDWTQLDSFDTAAECKKELSEYQEQTRNQARAVESNTKQAERIRMFYYARAGEVKCVASDHPRLKER
jgi:hypothetical protein